MKLFNNCETDFTIRPFSGLSYDVSSIGKVGGISGVLDLDVNDKMMGETSCELTNIGGKITFSAYNYEWGYSTIGLFGELTQRDALEIIVDNFWSEIDTLDVTGGGAAYLGGIVGTYNDQSGGAG